MATCKNCGRPANGRKNLCGKCRHAETVRNLRAKNNEERRSWWKCPLCGYQWNHYEERACHNCFAERIQ